MKINKKNKGENDVSNCNLLNNLGIANAKMGHSGKAIDLFRESLAKAEAADGFSVMTAMTLHNIGQVLDEEGNHS